MIRRFYSNSLCVNRQMDACFSIQKLLIDIDALMIELVKICETSTNGWMVTCGEEAFLLPATLQQISQRANGLQRRLQRHMRTMAQQRRQNIVQGSEATAESERSSPVDVEAWKTRLSRVQSSPDRMLSYLRALVDAFELYDDLQTNPSVRDPTFRLLPVLQHIQKQVVRMISVHHVLLYSCSCARSRRAFRRHSTRTPRRSIST